jgi:hypothetical protein
LNTRGHGGPRTNQQGRPKKIGPSPPGVFDPRAVLALIAADPKAPAGPRVAAARALMAAPDTRELPEIDEWLKILK